MQKRLRLATYSFAAGLGLPLTASAGQVLHGITRPVFGTNPPNVHLSDLSAGTNELQFDFLSLPGTEWSAPGFTGLAADDAAGIIYGAVISGTNSNIYALDYATLTPTLVTETRRDAATLGPVIDGLAYDTARGRLYGTRVLGGSTGAEGLWDIDLATGISTLLFEYETTATSDFTIGGIDYDPSSDRIYLADDDSTGGRNIYSLDPDNLGAGLQFVTAFPAGVDDVDGLAAGDGQVFLLTDNANSNGGQHYVYDVLAGTYSSFASPYPAPAGSPIAPNPTGGAAYVPSIPEPGTAALLLLAGGLLARGRRLT